MADQDDVRRIASALPDAVGEGMSYRVNGRQICWPWMERIDPKKPRVANREVLVVRVASELDKRALVAMDADVFLTEAHYDGYAAVMVRLARVDEGLLAKLISDAAAIARSMPTPRPRKR